MLFCMCLLLQSGNARWHLLQLVLEFSCDGAYLQSKGGQLAARTLAMLLVISSAGSSALQKYRCQATRRRVGREIQAEVSVSLWWRLNLAVLIHVVSETGSEKVINFEASPVRWCVLGVLCLLR